MPVVALGADGAPGGTPGAEAAIPAALLDAREEVAADTEHALEAAPIERAGQCGATLEVDGLGETCRTGDGLLRVELPDGTSFTTHGADAPPLEVDSAHLPSSQTAVDSADRSDIACTPTTSKHVTLVYARPSDRTSRYTTVRPLLQQEAYKMSAFLDAESQAVSSDNGKRLRFRCDDDGTPTVLNATLPALGASTGSSFSQVVDGLKGLGYEHFSDSGALERYVVFYDAPSSGGAAGTGHLYEDSSPSADNLNNKGGMYAVEYRWTYGGGVPHWDVMLHEAGHNMGALSDNAPHSSGAGHCNDGLDIMCYDDGGSTSNYGSGSCSTEQFDCHRDDYYNPVPAPGSYLATHWNAAASYNAFLQHRFLGDQTPPTGVTGLVQTGASDSTVGFSWSASSDDTAVTGYGIYMRPGEGAAWSLQTSNAPTVRHSTISLLQPLTSYQVGIRAYDAAGNGSPIAVLAVATNNTPDVIAPASPSTPVLKVAMNAVQIAWTPSSDDVGVAFYEVLREVPTSDPAVRNLRSAGTTSGDLLTASGLKPNTSYTFRIVAHDDASNESEPLRVTIRTLRDTQKPTTPTLARSTARTTSSVRMAWGRSSDNVGVTRYHVYRLRGATWFKIGTLGAYQRAVTVTGLQRHTTYRYRIRAVDGAGNLSAFSTVIRGTTL